MSLGAKDGTKKGGLGLKGYLLGLGRYPCVARGARGRSHGGNVGRSLGAVRAIHIVGVGGGHHLRGAS